MTKSIRKKALIVYLCAILIGMMVMFLTVGVVTKYLFDKFEEEGRINRVDVQMELYSTMRLYVNQSPDLLLSDDFLQLLKDNNMDDYVILTKGSDILIGEGLYSDYLLEDWENYIISTFEFADGSNGVMIGLQPVHLGKDSGKGPASAMADMRNLGVAFLVLMIVAQVGILMYFINRVLKPLEEMKEAAIAVKEGQLDFDFQYEVDDEVGEVFMAFGEMVKGLKEASDLREQYERNRNELISNISHDLKTPITSIKGYIEGVLDGVADSPEKLQKYSKIIYKNASDMDELINDLFLMSKLDSDTMAFEFDDVDLNSFLEDYVEEMGYELELNQIDIDYINKSKESCLVKLDTIEFGKALNNLMTNSIKHFNKEEKRIEVTLNKSGAKAIIRVTDNGTGIEPSELDKIFDRFYRIDSARNSKVGGSGIGLSIVKKIVSIHNGRIHAESEVGQGTTMVIELDVLD